MLFATLIEIPNTFTTKLDLKGLKNQVTVCLDSPFCMVFPSPG